MIGAIDWAQAAATGLIGAGGIVLGVVLAEWLGRLRDRRSELERAVIEVGRTAPYVLVAFMEQGKGTDRSVNSEWMHRSDEVFSAINIIRLNARWPIRHAKEIRDKAMNLASCTMAANARCSYDGVALTYEEYLTILDTGIATLVFPGDPSASDEAFQRYRREGFPSPEAAEPR